jgi:hypothetical protein
MIASAFQRRFGAALLTFDASLSFFVCSRPSLPASASTSFLCFAGISLLTNVQNEVLIGVSLSPSVERANCCRQSKKKKRFEFL